MPAQLIFGDIKDLDPSEVKATLQEIGITRLDTAARYMNGESEKKLGRSKLAQIFTVDTKVLVTGSSGDGSLTPEAIERSLSHSLEVLGINKVNVLYCHSPDHKTPIADQARGFDEQFKRGRFTMLGVSNFSPSMLEEWLSISEKEGYVKPSVYQGQYNLLCRAYESTLFPLLRKNDIHFTAFSPLAGGFLLGNFTAEGKQGGSRFVPGSPFTQWYDHTSMHEAIKRLRSIAERERISMDELSMRWVVHHSILNDEDAAILGASKVHQVKRNVAQIRKGPLDGGVVQELEALWEGVKEDGVKIIEY